MIGQLSWFEEHLLLVLTVVTSTTAIFGGLVATIRRIIINAVRPSLESIHRRIDEHMRIEEAEMGETRDLAKQTAENVDRLCKHVDKIEGHLEQVDARYLQVVADLANLQGRVTQEQGGKQHGD